MPMQNQQINPQVQSAMPAGQQERMTEPPQVISTKDYNYITDALSWELLAVKKLNHFAQESQDPKVKSLLSKSAQMHQKHYSILLKHLNPANSTSKLQS